MKDTLRLWDAIKAKHYDVYVSAITIGEIQRCPEPKRTLLINYLAEIEHTVIEATEEIEVIAQCFIDNKILTDNSRDDCRHIAYTIVSGCDVIVSWNFKHIVNYKTIRGVKLVSALSGYNEIAIYTPTILIEGNEES
jgi:hypothetical protein